VGSARNGRAELETLRRLRSASWMRRSRRRGVGDETKSGSVCVWLEYDHPLGTWVCGDTITCCTCDGIDTMHLPDSVRELCREHLQPQIGLVRSLTTAHHPCTRRATDTEDSWTSASC
jgi:hypothetical protein